MVVVVEVLRVTGAHMTVHASVMRRVNDSLFASLSAEGFAGLSTQISDVLEDADRTLRKLPYYLEDT